MDASQFDDIRPYVDAEIPAAMARIADSEVFALLSAYVFPDRPLEEVREEVRGYKSVYEFQHGVMWFVNKQIEARSTAEVKVTGLENLDTRRNYLFVSNHRDIMLDASFLQNALVEAGHDTTEITFGANLMHPQLVVDIGCSNKMFKVERGDGTPRAFYESSKHLSDYIRYTILEKKQSVWIAQRNGRTKDGNDATAPGIIKMFGMSGGKDKVDALAELGITPVAISYEWEPCDLLKALELYAKSSGQPYVKKPGEDLNSILTGITLTAGRALGETAILIFTAGTTVSRHRFDFDVMAGGETLAVHLWYLMSTGLVPDRDIIADGIGALLLLIILAFNMVLLLSVRFWQRRAG